MDDIVTETPALSSDHNSNGLSWFMEVDLQENVTDDLPMPPLFQFLTVLAFKIFSSEEVGCLYLIAWYAQSSSSFIPKSCYIWWIFSLNYNEWLMIFHCIYYCCMLNIGQSSFLFTGRCCYHWSWYGRVEWFNKCGNASFLGLGWIIVAVLAYVWLMFKNPQDTFYPQISRTHKYNLLIHYSFISIYYLNRL